MGKSRKQVSTEKPRVTGYLSPEIHQKFETFVFNHSLTQSAAIEKAIKILIALEPEEMEKLEEIASRELRNIEEQAAYILIQALKNE